MKRLKDTLMRQLMSLAIVICGILFISLGIFLPRVLVPVYEKNLYQYLEEPLRYIQSDIDKKPLDTDIAYLYVISDKETVTSDNLDDIIKADIEQILSKIDKKYGKFRLHGENYYYMTVKSQYGYKISLTDDSYINEMKADILYIIFPIMLITLLLISGLMLLWSRRLVLKIEHLKEKIDNLGNDEYVDNYDYVLDDELKALSEAIDDMKATLKAQEEYKNQMYQNISHDFKTPLTIIKSYMEAAEDGLQEPEIVAKIVEEQIDKLEAKVHSLLYLNKLNYIIDSKNYKQENVDVALIIHSSIEKFKIQRSDIKWEIHIADKKTIFNGTYDMWEAVIDNLLNNFMRYADKKIKVTIKNHRITFYNDGPNIDPAILNDIFTPYKKGIKGQFGLGLSIVKKTVALMGYEVNVKNEKKGVCFIIK